MAKFQVLFAATLCVIIAGSLAATVGRIERSPQNANENFEVEFIDEAPEPLSYPGLYHVEYDADSGYGYYDSDYDSYYQEYYGYYQEDSAVEPEDSAVDFENYSETEDADVQLALDFGLEFAFDPEESTERRDYNDVYQDYNVYQHTIPFNYNDGYQHTIPFRYNFFYQSTARPSTERRDYNGYYQSTSRPNYNGYYQQSTARPYGYYGQQSYESAPGYYGQYGYYGQEESTAPPQYDYYYQQYNNYNQQQYDNNYNPDSTVEPNRENYYVDSTGRKYIGYYSPQNQGYFKYYVYSS